MPHSFRFTTRRLLFLIAAFALSFATLPGLHYSRTQRWEPFLDWPAFLLSLISFLAIFGLCQQIKDIWQCSMKHHGASSSRPERFAIGLAISWRAALGAGLAACYGLQFLINRRIVGPDFRGTEDLFHNFGNLFPDLAWSLLVFIILAAIPGGLPPRRGQSALAGTRRVVGSLLVCGFMVVILAEMTLVHYLVHVATVAIEVHQPLHLQRPGIFPDHAWEGYVFFWTSCFAAALVPANFMLLLGFADATRRGSWWKWPILCILIAGLIVTTGYATWYGFRGLPRVSPDMAVASLPLNKVTFAFLVAALTTLGLVMGLRLSKHAAAESQGGRAWRRVNGYLHEKRATGLLALSLGVCELASIHDPLRGYILRHVYEAVREFLSFGSANGLLQAAGWALHWPPTYLWLAITWLAVRLLFRRRRCEDPADMPTLQPISPRRFAAFFALAIWLVTSAVFVLAAFAFAWWLGPWFG